MSRLPHLAKASSAANERELNVTVLGRESQSRSWRSKFARRLPSPTGITSKNIRSSQLPPLHCKPSSIKDVLRRTISRESITVDFTKSNPLETVFGNGRSIGQFTQLKQRHTWLRERKSNFRNELRNRWCSGYSEGFFDSPLQEALFLLRELGAHLEGCKSLEEANVVIKVNKACQHR